MKKMVKVILAAAAIVALAAPAMAAGTNKLIVRNTGNTADAFSVTDDGTIKSSSGNFLFDGATGLLGIGTGGATPISQFTLVDQSAAATRGLNVFENSTGTAANTILFRKSRGTYAVPTTAVAGDYVGAFHGAIHDGTAYLTTATINYFVDGTVATGTAPQALLFYTGQNTKGVLQPGAKLERLRITSTGNVVIANKAGEATAANIPLTATDGHLYIPTSAGAVTSCATMTTYAGHAPVWVDATNLKVCSCIAGALKCTAAMN